MSDKKYVLRYLPLFYSDLEQVVNYISVDLQNVQAAENIVNLTEKAIFKRLENPEAFQPYQPSIKLKNKYYYIKVNNYIVFYVVIDNVMEIRRFLYKGMDTKGKLQ
jgi:plasmid stabilization system protein ParE